MDTTIPAIQSVDIQRVPPGHRPTVNEKKIKKVPIIIPAYNEEKTLTFLLDRVIEVRLLNQIEKEIIVINDHSTEGELTRKGRRSAGGTRLEQSIAS